MTAPPTIYNQNITSPASGRSQPASVLYNFSDHLPVMVDDQLPAVLNVATATAPTMLTQGEAFSLDVLIRNAANVVAALGADELDWALSTSGSLTGSASGTSLALAGASVAQVVFDTSTIGLTMGSLLITSSSQAAVNASVSIPFSYQVVAGGPVGDFNLHGFVDAADFTVWRDTFAIKGVNLPADADGNGIVNRDDYNLWRANFGEPAAMAGGSPVPEPLGVVAATMFLAMAVGSRLRSSNGPTWA
ncbi:hypothetical protein Pla175_21310 [Pirellulimonas nuda]|uniref:PEP-CTERM protein-sorting domain-containing protein n=1 Tax=Pirellulimonas nuda TaxID=2528009 RepID=A0A518DB84_9BACT|nr:hypothetical protein [Pirellulimonas nuda]QDU88749.1 hypothetical protein Pla175_21310 [Pirellulimonas nuda]